MSSRTPACGHGGRYRASGATRSCPPGSTPSSSTPRSPRCTGAAERGTDHLSELDDERLADPYSLTDPHTASEQTELRHTLLLAVQRLPDPLREVVVRRELRGLSHDAIATELGISESASKVRLHRARAKLRTELGGDRDHEQLPIGA